MTQRLIIILTVAGWLVVAILVAQTNLIGFKTATLRWPNVTQPNTVFHWAGNLTARGIIPVDTEAVAYISVPRQFNAAILKVATRKGSGQLQIKVAGTDGVDAEVVGQAGATISLPLVWSQLATKTKLITVRLRAADQPVTITGASLVIRK